MKQQLQSTGTKKLAEASPLNPVWGIDLGQNLMLQRRGGQSHPADLLHRTPKRHFRRAAHLEALASRMKNLAR